MADIFLTKNVQELLKDKKVVLLGDSNVRAMYKDLICVSQKNALISSKVLKHKMEKSVYGDQLVDHGKLSKGRDYREHRKFTSHGFNISYYFITKVYSTYVEDVLKTFEVNGNPDVLMLNSCLWDICRWGPKGVEIYRQNLKTLMTRFNKVLDEKCVVIWLTTPPISQEMKGGFLVDQLEFLKYSLRFHVLEANNYARQVVVRHGYDVVDVHYHLRMQLTQRAGDGIHWLPLAVRHVTNMILTHISLAWGVPLPLRYNTTVTRRVMVAQENDVELQYDEPSGTMPVVAEKASGISALKDIKNNQKSVSNSPAKKKVKADTKKGSYHSFQKREKVRQSKQRIRHWRPEPALLPHPYVQNFGSPTRSAMHPVPHSSQRPPPYYMPQTPPMSPIPSLVDYYHRYAQNRPAPYQFHPEFAKPQFSWADMRQLQFGSPPVWRPR